MELLLTDSREARGSHLDRALRVAALLLAIVLGVLSGTEALVRALFVPPLRPYTANGFYRGARTPNYKAYKVSIEDGQPFEYAVDPLGFRGKSLQTVKKAPGVRRIFFVGASTTENQHLPEEKTFPGLVEARLRARGLNVEVGNAGIGGHGAARSFAIIAHRILALEPDLIVVLEGENDLTQSFDEHFDPTNAENPLEVKLTFKDWLLTKSRLVQILDAPKEVDLRPFLEKGRAEARKRPYFVPKEIDPLRGLAPFESYLRKIALVCGEARVPVIFMTQPTLWKVDNTPAEKDALWLSSIGPGPIHIDPATCRKLMDAYNDATRRVAAGHVLVDLDRVVPRDLEHFYDDAHMTALGNEVVASAVVAAIEGKGLLPLGK